MDPETNFFWYSSIFYSLPECTNAYNNKKRLHFEVESSDAVPIFVSRQSKSQITEVDDALIEHQTLLKSSMSRRYKQLHGLSMPLQLPYWGEEDV